jgi:hypothetical protein
VSQKKLDLLQLASRRVAKPSTGPSQIVRCQLRHSDASGGFLYDVPNRFYCHPISPCPSYFVDPAKQLSRSIPAAASQLSSSVLTQSGTGTVRTWPPLPTRSTMAQCSSRCWRWSNLNATASCRLKSHASSNASNARSRFPFLVVDDRVLAKDLGPALRSANCRGALPTSSRP